MSLVITILTDESSWMNQYNEILSARLKETGHRVMLVKSKKELATGDVAFFLSCFEIVSGKYLSYNKHNIVVHASALPAGKGWSPATWQILEGKNDIPITLFEATEKVDAGDIYIEDILNLNGTELLDEWREKLGIKIVEMCCKFVDEFQKGSLHSKKQEGCETFFLRRNANDSRLDVNKTIAEQFNLLRVVDNVFYPAFFEYNGCRYVLKILREENNE